MLVLKKIKVVSCFLTMMTPLQPKKIMRIPAAPRVSLHWALSMCQAPCQTLSFIVSSLTPAFRMGTIITQSSERWRHVPEVTQLARGKDQRSVLVAQSCLTLSHPMDCSPPGSSVHGILQARILEWVAISFPKGSSWPRGQTQVSQTGGSFFTIWATREALYFF